MTRLSKMKGDGKTQQYVLPTYKLDSNLILLPGIIYNITLSRVRAQSLLSRYWEQAGHLPILAHLLSGAQSNNANSSRPNYESALSSRAVEDIKALDATDFKLKTRYSKTPIAKREFTEFDWLVVALEPNLSKIKDPKRSELKSDVVTITRIIGILDDNNNVRLTAQALIRGSKVSGFRLKNAYESLYNVCWEPEVNNFLIKFDKLDSSVFTLFDSLNLFIGAYKESLKAAQKTNDNPNAKISLLCLNPLANALYMQVGANDDFRRAYLSLQKLFKSVAVDTSLVDEYSILKLLDLSCGIVPFPNYEKLQFLNTLNASKRFHEIMEMISRFNSLLSNLRANSAYVDHWYYEEASNLQRGTVVASQLKSIRFILEDMANDRSTATKSNGKGKLVRRSGMPNSNLKLGNLLDDGDGGDDDESELKAIAQFIKNKLPTVTSLLDDSKRLIAKDFKRLKSSSPGNSEHQVLRNYLEIVSDFPWDTFVTKYKLNKDINIDDARKKLDKDHYGLEHVKKRLVQYLVVLKLLGINAEKSIQKLVNQNTSKEDPSKYDGKDSSIVIHETEESQSAAPSDAAPIDIEKERALLTSKDNKSPIILFAGPPGTGKTSMAKSIASALGRNYQRIALGGVKDESEIRGHRRTYVGAMPGVIVQAIRKSRSMNPVILLDEIDKVVGSLHMASKVNGDPAAALLEVLDPEQNTNFTDHYLGFPIDLSQVIFICTANDPYQMPGPLLDRLEMIQVPAYTFSDKIHISQKYLLPRQIKRNGFPVENMVQISDDVIRKVILDYTREAGVRGLERKLGTICRFKAVDYAQTLEGDSISRYDPVVEEYDLSKYLGIPYPSMSSDIVESPIQSSKYGVVNGLSYNTDGSGSVLVFESIGFVNENTKSSLNMTGRLGEVLMESAKIGLTFIRLIVTRNLLAVADQIAVAERLQSLEVHLHVPLGSISKDGPSAGITMALLFLSLLLEKPVPYDIAMTGEITLRGLVLPIGGLREKLMGAHLAGIKRVIVPRENRKDIIDDYIKSVNDDSKLNALLKDNESKYNFINSEPEEFVESRYGIKITYASEFWDVIQAVWGDDMIVKVGQARMLEYHL